MAKDRYEKAPYFTYDQMMHRRHEIQTQSPWLEDYELDALLADEGYNISEKAPEGYVFSTGEEESGIDFIGERTADDDAPLEVKDHNEVKFDPYAAYFEQMDVDSEILEDKTSAPVDVVTAIKQEESPEMPPIPSNEEYQKNQQERQLRDKARKILSRNIREETGKMGFALIIFIVLQLAITGIITAYLLFVARYKISEINVFLATPSNMLPIQGIILMLGLGLPFIGYMYLFKLPLGETIPVRKMRIGNFLLLVLFGLGFSTTVSYIGNIVQSGELVTGGLSNLRNVLAGNQGIELLYSIICLCIIPALVEEFVFRGVILQVLRRKGGDTFAIILSALMCALVYSNTQGISAFFIALLMGYIVVFSGSVLPAIVIGLLRSALSLVMTLLGMSVAHDRLAVIDAGATILLIAAGLFAVIGIFRKYPDFFKIKEGKSSLSLKEKLVVAIKTPSMILLILYFIFFAIIENIPTEDIIGRLS